MEGLAKKVEQVLNRFAEQEIGNRLSDFAMLALKQIVLNEVMTHKVVKKEAKK